MGEAVRRLCDAGRVDHIDLNFGCPAAKVTRKGGGAAVPAKPRLLRAILRAAVPRAAPYGVPVTAKFRKGLTDDLLTFRTTGRIAADEGVAAIALHARTAEQHYAGAADWDAIGELKDAVPEIPVLGNGDIWEAADALAMMRATGCDGVVVGRGCLGRPWLFADLVAVLNGLEPVAVAAARRAWPTTMRRSRRAARRAPRARTWRCATSASTPRGTSPATRSAARPAGGSATCRTLAELDDLLGALDPTLALVPGGERIRRGHTNGPIRVALPAGYLDDPDDVTPPDDADVMALSGG